MPGFERAMKLDIAMLVNIALFNKLILDVNIGGLFFDSHFTEPHVHKREKKKNKRKQEKFNNPDKG